MSAPSMTSTSARSRMNTKVMVSMAMLTGIAYIVMLASKLMPSVMFLDFDFKDVIICIGGFTFGPLAAAVGYGLAVWYGFRNLDGMSGDISGFALTIGELCGCGAAILWR